MSELSFWCRLIFCLAALIIAQAGPQPANALSSGEQLYNSGHYEEAREWFRKEQGKRPDARLLYNLGNTEYQLRHLEKARKNWMDAAAGAPDKKLKEHALYNTGNSFFEESRYNEAALYYLQALRLDPADVAARRNLEISLTRISRDDKVNKKDIPGKMQNKGQELSSSRCPNGNTGKAKSSAKAGDKKALQAQSSSPSIRKQEIPSQKEINNMLKAAAEGKQKVKLVSKSGSQIQGEIGRQDW